MEVSDLLDGLLTLFSETVEGVDFLRAWRGEARTRRLERPTVTGEVDGEVLKPDSEEQRLKFRIFLPEGESGRRAEEIFSAMCAAAGSAYPGFSAISRGAADRNKVTGLLCVTCTMSFLSQTGGGGSGGPGRRVVIGGREYHVSGVKTAFGAQTKELVSIGETEPFALTGESALYTVEIEGIDTAGLDRLASFTVEIGDGPDAVYENCRWKSLSDALRKAVFLSARRS